MPVVYGMNHASAPQTVRERVAFAEPDIPEAVARLRRIAGVEEALILSTCNRTELTVCMKSDQASTTLAGFLARERPITEEELVRHCYLYSVDEAVRHVFRTAASLDSMVVGEAQILGQVKKAYALAGRAGSLGSVLDALYRRAIMVARKVRNETGIGRNPVSIAYAAAGLARDIFGGFEDTTVLIVGAGKMARLAAQHLIGHGVRTVLVANRSFQRADELARDLGGRAVPFDRLFQEMERADIVIASTSAPHTVIQRDDAQRLSRARRGRPIFFVDIAMPRDVDPGVNEVDNVYLYDLDDLQRVVRANQDGRREEVVTAEAIIEREAAAFLAWSRSLQVAPTIVELRRHLHDIAAHELARFHGRLGTLTSAQEGAVRQMAESLVNKLLHSPTLALKQAAAVDGGELRVRLIREIFGIESTVSAALPADDSESVDAPPQAPGSSRKERG